MPGLPEVGAQAVILGMAAFNSNSRQVITQLNSINAAALRLEKSGSAFSAFSSSSTSAFGAVAAGVGLAIAALGSLAVTAEVTAAKYLQQMTFISAVGEVNSKGMAQLNATQMQLSRTTTSNAFSLAQMSAELVKAGISVDQLGAGALKASNDLILASAGELQAADAAKVVANGLGAFHTTAEVAVNAATAAVQNSTLSFTDYAAAVRNGAGVAAQFGLTQQEFAATVGTAARSVTLAGSQIGAGIAMMLQRLQNPTKEAVDLMKQYGISLYDAQGKARPWLDILKGLETQFGKNAIATGKITQAERDHALAVLFSSRAAKVVAAILDEGTQGYDQMLNAVNNLTASGLAAEQMQTTAAQAKILGNNLTDLGIAFGSGLDPFINDTLKSLNAWFQAIDLDKVTQFGVTIGKDVYNAFANFGNLMDTKVTPSMTVFQAIATAAAILVEAQIVQMVAKSLPNILLFARALTSVAVSAILGLASAVGVSGAAIVGGIALVLGATALFVVAWRKNWLNVQDIVSAIGDNVYAIARRIALSVASLLDKAADAARQLGIVKGETAPEGDAIRPRGMTPGEAFLKGLDPVAATLKAVPAAAADAGAAVEAFAEKIKKTVASVKDFKIEFHDFAGDVEKALDRARATRDAALSDKAARPIAKPEGAETSPGNYFDDVGKKAEDAYNKASAKLQELNRDFEKDVRIETGHVGNEIAKLYEKTATGLEQAMSKAERDIAKIVQDAQNQINRMSFDRIYQADASSRREALKDRQEDEARERQHGIDEEEVKHQRSVDATKREQDAQREYRERTNDMVLEDIARKRARDREDEDNVFQKSQDALRDKLTHDQDHKEQALRADHDRRERDLRDAQDARERDLRAQFDAEKNALRDRQKLRQINEDDARERAKALAEYNKQIALGVKESIAKARYSEATGKLDEKKSDLLGGLASDQRDRAEQDALEADQQNRMVALQTGFHSQRLSQRVDFEKELTDLHEQQERDRKALDARLDAEALKRRRDRETEDVNFQRQQDLDRRKFRNEEEAKALIEQRKLEDAERVRKLQQEASDVAFRRQQELDRATLEKKLDDEEFGRRVNQANAERDERVRAVTEALNQEQEKIQGQLAQEIVDLQTNLQTKLDTVKERYIDKLDDILKEGGNQLQPAVDLVTNSISEGLYNIRDAAQEAVNKLAEVFGAVDALNKANEAAARAMASVKLPSHQYGGTVEGAYGTPKLIVAHGGERFEGIGGYALTNAAVRSAEAMWSRGIGSSSTVTNHTTYSVQANYGRTQDEGSIAQDLSALVSLTKR